MLINFDAVCGDYFAKNFFCLHLFINISRQFTNKLSAISQYFFSKFSGLFDYSIKHSHFSFNPFVPCLRGGEGGGNKWVKVSRNLLDLKRSLPLIYIEKKRFHNCFFFLCKNTDSKLQIDLYIIVWTFPGIG